MKNKIKKILGTTVISAITLTSIGGSLNAKLTPQNSCSKALESTSQQTERYGKLVETMSEQNNSYIAGRSNNYLNNTVSSDTIENEISNMNNTGVKLFILSEAPFMSFSSDENSAHFNMIVKFTGSSQTPETTSSNLQTSDSNEISLKKSILSVYTNELLNGNISLSEDDKTNINNQLSNTSDSSIDSIIEVLERNLTSSSSFYQSKLTSVYENLSNNSSNSSNEHYELAQKIISTYNLKSSNNSAISNSTNQTNNNDSNQNQSTETNTTNSSEQNERVRNLNINQNDESSSPSSSENTNNSIQNNNQSLRRANRRYYRRNRNRQLQQNTTQEQSNMTDSTRTNQIQNNTNSEQYSPTTATSYSVNERAERVPYTTNTTFKQ